MKVTTDIQRFEKVTTKVYCNKCEKDCYRKGRYDNIDGASFYVEGYSTFLPEELYIFDLCSVCIHNLIATFKIPPTTEL